MRLDTGDISLPPFPTEHLHLPDEELAEQFWAWWVVFQLEQVGMSPWHSTPEILDPLIENIRLASLRLDTEKEELAAGVLVTAAYPMILSIDPGVSGAYALLGGSMLVDDLPVHQAQHGRSAKIRAELDLHGFREQLACHAIEHVFIERAAARPGQGVTSMFRFGESSGAVYGLIVGLRLPVTLVTPQQWQKFHQVGPSPDAARQRAMQLYPQLAPKLALKKDQHRADALLIGAYGLQQLVNGGHGYADIPRQSVLDCLRVAHRRD